MSDSWRLKFERAKEHIKDLEDEARFYSDSHPYELVRIIHRHREPRQWGYKIRITEQPRDRAAVILGDVIHNLRSALDHIVAACVPKSTTQASFPIEAINPWRRVGRKFQIRDPEVRKRFTRQIRGIAPKAEIFIKGVQPYRFPEPERQALRLLARLDNLDKHRRLILIGAGVINPVIYRTFPNGDMLSAASPFGNRIYYADDAEVYRVEDLAEWLRDHAEGDVKVECRATTDITVEIRGDAPQRASRYHMLRTVESAAREVSNILDALEPYAIR